MDNRGNDDGGSSSLNRGVVVIDLTGEEPEDEGVAAPKPQKPEAIPQETLPPETILEIVPVEEFSKKKARTINGPRKQKIYYN